MTELKSINKCETSPPEDLSKGDNEAIKTPCLEEFKPKTSVKDQKDEKEEVNFESSHSPSAIKKSVSGASQRGSLNDCNRLWSHGLDASAVYPQRYQYPLLYVSPTGTMSVLLRDDVIVEITIDKSIRVLCSGKFSVASNGRGTASCIMHPMARIYQEDTKVYSHFGNEKLAVFGSQGILFTMKRLNQAYLVSSTIHGTSSIPLSCVQFPSMESDFTLTLFYFQSQFGEPTIPLCQEIVKNAHYEQRDDGSMVVTVNGVFIRQDKHGNVDVNTKPRHIRVSPHSNTLTVRTHFVDIGVQEDEKCFLKRGVKRIHVSKSGMVVSDGNSITSMDQYGRIVSST